MKELSIEEKAKAYDNVREKIAVRFGSNVANEIFSEYEESEDERIRKDLILYLKSILSNKKYGDKFIEDWIAWLEKQAEQKPVVIIPKFRVGDEIKTSNEESLTITKIDENGYWSEDLFICDFDEECLWDLVEQKPDEEYNITGIKSKHAQGKLGEMIKNLKPVNEVLEQKSADNVERKGMNITEEDMTPFQKEVSCIIDITIEEEQGLKQVCDELLRLAHDEIMQKTAWSEKEKNILDDIIHDYEMANKSFCGYEARINWLKSLKDRVQPQPKKEWNYNDEIIIGTIIQEIEKIPSEKFIDNAKYRCLDWLRYRLKSLRPQSLWKPSKEQMNSLKQAINTFPYETDYLELLYDDLKKLKE